MNLILHAADISESYMQIPKVEAILPAIFDGASLGGGQVLDRFREQVNVIPEN